MVDIPASKDVIQIYSKKYFIQHIPEIRVWIHPKKGGDDYYNVFENFKEAMEFIKTHKDEAEEVPLIAFRGYELNLFALENAKTEFH